MRTKAQHALFCTLLGGMKLVVMVSKDLLEFSSSFSVVETVTLFTFMRTVVRKCLSKGRQSFS